VAIQTASYRPAGGVTYKPPNAPTSLPGYANFEGLNAYSQGGQGGQYAAGINPGIFNLQGLQGFSGGFNGLNGLNAYSGLADYSGLSSFPSFSGFNFGQQQQQQQQQPIFQQAAAFQQGAFPYGAPPANFANFPGSIYGAGQASGGQAAASQVAQSTKVGPATFGTHGGAAPNPPGSQVSNGGYGFTRAPSS
jgi:hypothetical protein